MKKSSAKTILIISLAILALGLSITLFSNNTNSLAVKNTYVIVTGGNSPGAGGVNSIIAPSNTLVGAVGLQAGTGISLITNTITNNVLISSTSSGGTTYSAGNNIGITAANQINVNAAGITNSIQINCNGALCASNTLTYNSMAHLFSISNTLINGNDIIHIINSTGYNIFSISQETNGAIYFDISSKAYSCYAPSSSVGSFEQCVDSTGLSFYDSDLRNHPISALFNGTIRFNDAYDYYEWDIGTSSNATDQIYTFDPYEYQGNGGYPIFIINNQASNPGDNDSVGFNTSTPNTIYVADFNGSTLFEQNIRVFGHIVSSLSSDPNVVIPAPTVSSCGSSPSISGTDVRGAVTIGTGIVTSCTINFGTRYPTPPICTVSDNSAAVSDAVTSVNSIALVAGFGTSLGGGKLYYICIG